MEQVFRFIRSYNLISPHDEVLVAVSGGADSMALLSLMIQLRDRGGLKGLLCVHLNHQLRPEADQDEACVRAMGAAFSVRYLCQRLDVNAYAKLHRCSIETAGRDCRLQALRDLALQHGCTAVATGHHKNDTAETLVQRLTRGTGFRGLCGIWPLREQDGLRWVRPLLNVTHQELQQYLKDYQLTWREDTTNQEQRFRRNFIRHTLLPQLQSESQDDLVETLHDLSLTGYRCYNEKIRPHVEKLTTSAIAMVQDKAVLNIPAIRSESPLILSEVIRHILSLLECGEQAWTEKHYRDIMAMIKTSSSRIPSLPDHVHIVRNQDQLIFRRPRSPSLPALPETKVKLVLPGRTSFGPYLITTEFLTPSQYASIRPRLEKDRTIEVFDVDRLALPLTVRKRHPGDRFQPLGRKSAQKVGQFLNRARVPLDLKERIVLICDTQAVLWVCPVRISDHAKVTSSSQRLVKIKLNVSKTDPETEGHFQTADEYP